MALTEAQATVMFSQIQKRVTGMWVFFNYSGCPRELTSNNLFLLNKEMVESLEQFDQYPELGKLVLSVNTFQDALIKTISAVNLALDTFEYPTFLEQRRHFYKEYMEIFECISRARECLEASEEATAEKLVSGWQESVLAHLSERLTSIWTIFRYKHYGTHGLSPDPLLGFEKEIREILAKMATSQNLRNLFWSADKLQAGLRETVLHLNFAADILELSPGPERSREFSQMHTAIRDCLSQVINNLNLRG